MTDITELAQSLKAAAEKATQGEWWADEVKNEGCYGSGDDCVEGFTSYAIYGSDGQTLFDSLNSDAACICEEYDGEGHVAWDETAQRNAEFIAMANPANILALVEALEKAQQRIAELESRTVKLPDDEDGGCDATDRQLEALIRQSLAAMNGEPVAEVVSIYGDPEAFGEREIRPLVGIQQMPYGTKLYRHAQPAPEYPDTLPCPVLLEPGLRFGKGIKTSTMLAALARRAVYESDMAALSPEERAEFQARIEDFKALIAQPVPVVPQDVLEALQKVARIRLDLNGFDGDRRGIADCLCDAEEALIEVVNRRAAMIAAATQSPGSEQATMPGKWIPVSEQMPDENTEQQVLACFKGGDISTLYYFEGRWDDAYGIVPIRQDVTHWMPLPAAPQEVGDA